VKEMTLLVQDGQWMGLLPAISRLAIGAQIFTILANLSFRSDQKVAPSVLSFVPETCGVFPANLPAGSNSVGQDNIHRLCEMH
jgi:hypothetical protein